MITRDQFMDKLLDVCPSFESTWETHQDVWNETPTDLQLEIATTDFAEHLIHLLESSKNRTFPQIFGAVEQLLVEGDVYVETAIVMVLFENLQNLDLYSSVTPKDFEPHLGIESRRRWNGLYEFRDDMELSNRNAEEMMKELSDICPSFRPTWEEFLDDWEEEANNLPVTIAMGYFAGHLVHLLERSQTSTFPQIFLTVEQYLTESDHHVQTVIVTGLLEDLQNLNLYSTAEPKEIEPYLGAEARRACDDLYRFWDEVRTAQEANLLKTQPDLSRQVDLESIQDPGLRRNLKRLFRKG
jgi:hypothetical protein